MGAQSPLGGLLIHDNPEEKGRDGGQLKNFSSVKAGVAVGFCFCFAQGGAAVGKHFYIKTLSSKACAWRLKIKTPPLRKGTSVLFSSSPVKCGGGREAPLSGHLSSYLALEKPAPRNGRTSKNFRKKKFSFFPLSPFFSFVPYKGESRGGGGGGR